MGHKWACWNTWQPDSGNIWKNNEKWVISESSIVSIVKFLKTSCWNENRQFPWTTRGHSRRTKISSKDFGSLMRKMRKPFRPSREEGPPFDDIWWASPMVPHRGSATSLREWPLLGQAKGALLFWSESELVRQSESPCHCEGGDCCVKWQLKYWNPTVNPGNRIHWYVFNVFTSCKDAQRHIYIYGGFEWCRATSCFESVLMVLIMGRAGAWMSPTRWGWCAADYEQLAGSISESISIGISPGIQRSTWEFPGNFSGIPGIPGNSQVNFLDSLGSGNFSRARCHLWSLQSESGRVRTSRCLCVQGIFCCNKGLIPPCCEYAGSRTMGGIFIRSQLWSYFPKLQAYYLNLIQKTSSSRLPPRLFAAVSSGMWGLHQLNPGASIKLIEAWPDGPSTILILTNRD